MKKIFTSPHRNFVCEISTGLIQFTNSGLMGILTLDTETDVDTIELLLKHPDYNKRFTDKPLVARESNNIIIGVRTSSNTIVNESEFKNQIQIEMINKFKEYDSIKSQVVKLDGTPKKDADPELLLKFEQLKTELNI